MTHVAAPLPALPPGHAVTRIGWHAVAEQVLAGARFRASGRIGLEVAPSGFATPPFPGPSGRRVLRVEGTWFAVLDDELVTSRTPITTVSAAAEATGEPPGAPGSYPAATDIGGHDPLNLDAESATALAAWLALGMRALTTVLAGATPADDPTEPVLWPEHFDVGAAVGHGTARVNLGASLGDEVVPEPYLYVGPWQPPSPDPFWNAASFNGAVLRHRDVAHLDDPDRAAADFFRHGRALLAV